MTDTQYTIQEMREHLANKQGKAYWRSLEEIARTEAFQQFVSKEFPQGTHPGISRRSFLKFAAASLALAGLTACSPQAPEHIVPYVTQPEDIVQGQPLFFATGHLLGGFANGILAESLMGRPVKLEGNPEHPASQGKTDWFTQAELLTLYDPERSKTILQAGRIRTQERFFETLDSALNRQRAAGGRGLRILTPTITSPTTAAAIRRVLEALPDAQWHQWESVNRDTVYAGTELAFGEPLEPVYRMENATVICSLDADFMGVSPGKIRYTQAFSSNRQMRTGTTADMNRLYMVESTPSITGAQADHRWRAEPAQIREIAKALAVRLGIADYEVSLPDDWQPRIEALAADLQQASGALVLAGIGQPPDVHALAHAINMELGSVDETVIYTEPLIAGSTRQTDSLQTLVNDMQNGNVEALLIAGGNPVYDAPADIDFRGALQNVEFTAHLSVYNNDTSAATDWHIARVHPLETWNDARAYDGTVTIFQPLIAPLYDGISFNSLLARISESSSQNAQAMLREQWSELDDVAWRRTLHDGFIADSAAAPVDVSLQSFDVADSPPAEGFNLVFRPDHSIYDGRYINNGWLQETPRPFTKLTWDNAALVSPATAERLDIDNEDVLRITRGDDTLDIPAWILPGQADNTITLHLGYGQEQTGAVGSGSGFNAGRLRTRNALWSAANASVSNTNSVYPLASTQLHHSMEGRGLVQTATLETFLNNPDAIIHEEFADEPPSLYPDRLETADAAYQWGMSIDLTTCTGCNACLVACQAENNIPIVGKEQVQMGREMHWIRVDSYYGGSLDDPELLQQPVTCMHCEQAPCEPVCPVSATTHSSEGLNQMTYNRCVGTRYCANNCPYKVRRFNFLKWEADPELPILNNPEVTVRARGVMEKCTYCVQRINRARVEANSGGGDERIPPGTLQTACQQVCPADAIHFGDIQDSSTAVAQAKAQPHNYGLLTELGTRPRTTYLAQIRNPGPALTDSDPRSDNTDE